MLCHAFFRLINMKETIKTEDVTSTRGLVLSESDARGTVYRIVVEI